MWTFVSSPTEVTSLPSVLAAVSTEPLTEKFAGYNDPIFYIYTSGTTGMPKVTYTSTFHHTRKQLPCVNKKDLIAIQV